MTVAGIIAEYDPFHNGHAYHIKKTRELGADAVVVVLGGEFTQRGEPARFSKYLRAKSALLCGADLVLEMPVPYALGSAEKFAKGGVQILNALNCVDFLSFGSENENTDDILEFARICETKEFIEEYKNALQKGVSAPTARQIAMEALAPELSDICKTPNSTLGAEYCKWILRLNSKIKPKAIKRYGAGHGEISMLKSGIASATYLRSFEDPKDIFPFVPGETHALLELEHQSGKAPFNEHRFETAAMAILRTRSEEDFKKVPDAEAEGLYHRIFDAVRAGKSLEEIYSLAKTKRYAMARIKRIISASVLGINSERLNNFDIPYIRVLGMNERGAAVLKMAKEAGSAIPISSSLAELEKTSPNAEYFANLEATAEDLWQLGLERPGECGLAYRNKIIKL